MSKHNRWLGLNNRYWFDPISAIKNDIAAGGLKGKHAAEYVAASAPLHAGDGWTYLGRALQAHVSGNPDVARHLAYYAELRATMALLATQGIGIFNRQHFVIGSGEQATRLAERGTHSAAWFYLEEWAQSSGASALLGSILRPEGEPLEQWILALPRYTAWTPVGQDWLLTLGLDLRRLAEDRAARNRASYRPTSLSDTKYLTPAEIASFVLQFVGLLEPQAPGIFNRLDAHFLRISIESAFRASTNSTPRQARRQFRDSIDVVVDAMVNDAATRANLAAFLKRQVVPDDPVLIAEARRTDLPTHRRHHLQVMCRAALLLRIATGAAAHLLRTAGLTFAMAEPWWKPFGAVRGLWLATPDADDIVDLWLDVAGGLEEIRDWIDKEVDPTHRALLDDCAQPLSRVTSLEGLALVGMAS